MDRIPFREEELQIVGSYVATRGSGVPKYNTPVTPKENLDLWLKGDSPLWIPTLNDFLSFTPRVVADNVARGFAFDAEPPLTAEESGGPDMFGTEWVFIPQAGGSMVRPGSPRFTNANDWRDVINIPDVDSFDWETSAEINKGLRNSGRAFQATIMTGLFERLISFMDFENAAIALVDDEQQDAVHDLFNELADFNIRLIDKHLEYYGIDGVNFHDDWGSQRDPFFSLDTAREMLVPYLRRIVDHCHGKGLFFNLHSCGKNEKVVPAYIDAHVDMWAGQTMNDKEMLYEKYGDQIKLGLDLPDFKPGTPKDELEAFAKQFVAKYPKGNVFLSTRRVSPELIELLYKYSRIELCG